MVLRFVQETSSSGAELTRTGNALPVDNFLQRWVTRCWLSFHVLRILYSLLCTCLLCLCYLKISHTFLWYPKFFSWLNLDGVIGDSSALAAQDCPHRACFQPMHDLTVV